VGRKVSKEGLAGKAQTDLGRRLLLEWVREPLTWKPRPAPQATTKKG